jgi:integrase-like protein
MRRNLHSRALVNLEQETPRSMASSLKWYAYATIGKLTIPEIKPSRICELLRPIWVVKRKTANRVRGRIETIITKNINVDDTNFSKSRRTYQMVAREASKAAETRRAASSGAALRRSPHFMANLSTARPPIARIGCCESTQPRVHSDISELAYLWHAFSVTVRVRLRQSNGAKVHPACRQALSEVLRCKGCLWREAGMVL